MLPLCSDPSSAADPYDSRSLNAISPTLKDLTNFVVRRIAAVWYNVGLRLDLEPNVLDEIETEKSDKT